MLGTRGLVLFLILLAAFAEDVFLEGKTIFTFEQVEEVSVPR